MTSPFITVDAGDLRRALAYMMQIIERWNTFPVLSMVRLTAEDGRLTLAATDLDIDASVLIDLQEADGGFDALVAPRILEGLVHWHQGAITLRRVESDLLTVEAGDLTARLRELCPVSDWPVQQIGGWTDPIPAGEAVLHKAIGHAFGTISTEETRYYLNGIYLHAHDGALRMVSTDGHRLTVYDTALPWTHLPAILPRKMARVLRMRMIAGGNRDVQVRALVQMQKDRDGTERPWAARLLFEGDGWSLRSKMIDGTYPDYTRVIPTGEAAISVTVSHEALRRFPHTSFVRRAIEINPDAGHMTYREPYNGIDVSMPVIGKGGPFAVNLDYLRGFSRGSGVIRLAGTSKDNPFRILSDDPALLQVLMPMQV